MRYTMRTAVIAAVAASAITACSTGSGASSTHPTPTPAAQAPTPRTLTLSGLTTTTMTYGPQSGETLTLYAPVGQTKPKTTIIYVHGGGWDRSAVNASETAEAQSIANNSHWVVAAINYPVTAQGSTPIRQVEPNAVDAAVNYVAGLTKIVDPAHIILWGESAGGHLSLLDAYRDAAKAHPHVSAVVSVSGPIDMLDTYTFMASYFPGDPNNHNLVSDFLGATPSEAAAVGSTVYVNTSPNDQVTAAVPPTYAVNGSTDPLVPPGPITKLGTALAAVGVAHTTEVLNTAAHAYDLEPVVNPATGQTVQAEALGFLLTHYATRS